MAKTVDIKAIIDIYDLDQNQIANLLFPENKHPRLSLNRVATSDASLDSEQLARLASFLNVSVDDLYNETWKIESSENTLTFKSGEFVGKLNRKTWTTNVFHMDTLFHESVLHSQSITLSDYLEFLDELVTDYKNKTND